MAKSPNDLSDLAGEEDQSLLNRDFILTVLSVFIFFFNFHIFILLPVYIKELGGTESDVGFIMGAANFSTLFTTPAVGILVDRWGKKSLLACGGLVMAVSTFPFAYLHTLNSFIFTFLRIIHGAAFSLCFIAAGTLTADVTPASKRSHAIGLFGVFALVNYAFAPFVGRRIVENYDFSTLFLSVFMFGFLSFLVALPIKEPEKMQKSSVENNGRGNIITTLFRSGVFVAAFTLMISGYGFIPTLTFIPVFAKEVKVESFDLFFIACTLSALVVRVLGGWIPDRFGKKRAAIPSLLLFAVSIVGISFASNTSHFIETGILFGLSHGLVYPAIYALVIDLSPIIERGRAFAICSFAFNLGGTLGSFIYGVIAEHLGFQVMFQSAGLVCFFGFLVFTIFGRGKDSERTV